MLEVVLDVQMWPITLLTILVRTTKSEIVSLIYPATQISVSSGVVTTYSAPLIKTFGFSSPNFALLNTPSGLVSIVSTLGVGYSIRYTSHR